MELPEKYPTYQPGDKFFHKDDPTYKIKIIHVCKKAYDFTSNSIQQYYCIIHTNNDFFPPSDISAISLNKYYIKHHENRAKLP